MRIFLDANVIFSAASTNGAVRDFLTRLLAKRHVLCVDEYVLGEARRNLASRDSSSHLALERLVPSLEVAPFSSAIVPEARKLLPEKDQPVLSAAIRLQCNALVTGDRAHFGPLYGRTFSGVTIHSPRSLAELLL